MSASVVSRGIMQSVARGGGRAFPPFPLWVVLSPQEQAPGSVVLLVHGMTCASCVEAVTFALRRWGAEGVSGCMCVSRSYR